MKKLSIIILSLLIGSVSASVYNVGDQVSESHQNISFPVCYGDYPDANLSLSDFNGELNGGDWSVIWISMSATW